MTGIASSEILKYNLKDLTDLVREENKRVAELIGINTAARLTCVKPSGTTSCVLGTSSGIHAYHNDYYLRRMRVLKSDSLYKYLFENNKELIEDDLMLSNTAIITLPQKAPDNSILRTESALELLERVKKFNLEWVQQGHNRGDNTNNVSATISIKGPDSLKSEFSSNPIEASGEWGFVGEWMWNNKESYNGISVLPYDGGSYVQAPFENCSKEKYEELFNKLKSIDLTKIIELEDNVELQAELACSGNNCEVK